jgi:hypothetical protein
MYSIVFEVALALRLSASSHPRHKVIPGVRLHESANVPDGDMDVLKKKWEENTGQPITLNLFISRGLGSGPRLPPSVAWPGRDKAECRQRFLNPSRNLDKNIEQFSIG